MDSKILNIDLDIIQKTSKLTLQNLNYVCKLKICVYILWYKYSYHIESFNIKIPAIISLEGEIGITKLTSKFYQRLSPNPAEGFGKLNFFLGGGTEIYVKNLKIELENTLLTPNSAVSTDIIFGNDFAIIENVEIISKYTNEILNNTTGITSCKTVKNCIVTNTKIGISNSKSLEKNKTLVLNSGIKYLSCYASSDTSVPIPTGGSDTAQYSWNI